jgi:hypothetical protein
MPRDTMLDVPFVTQMKVGAHAGGNYFNDTTGCWYAAICMIAYYYAPGPRLGVPAQYTISKFMRDKDDNVIGEMAVAAEPIGARYNELMANEGLETVPMPASKKWTASDLCTILETKGPCYVRRGFRNKATGALEGGHAIVLVGCKMSTNEVFFHCPTLGPNRKVSLAGFNDFFKWDDPLAATYSMMCKAKASGGGSSVAELVAKFGG